MSRDLQSVIFYTIEKAIKSYRQFAQKELKKKGLDITVDQWLVLKSMLDSKEISQKELAKRVFKDAASITRILDLLEISGLVSRKDHATDRRRSTLEITSKGKKLLSATEKTVLAYRKKALKDIDPALISSGHQLLTAIITNCTEK